MRPPPTAPALPPTLVPTHRPATAQTGIDKPSVKKAGIMPTAAPATVPKAPVVVPPNTAPATAALDVTPTLVVVAKVTASEDFALTPSTANSDRCLTIRATSMTEA